MLFKIFPEIFISCINESSSNTPKHHCLIDFYDIYLNKYTKIQFFNIYLCEQVYNNII